MSGPHKLSTPVSRMGDTVQMLQLTPPEQALVTVIPDFAFSAILPGDAVALEITLLSGALEIFNGAPEDIDNEARPGAGIVVMPTAPMYRAYGLAQVEPFDDVDFVTGETIKRKAITLRGKGGPAEVNLVWHRGVRT